MTENVEILNKNNNENFEIFSDSDDIRADQNKVSKGIIQQIVTQKRRRTKLQDDLENLYLSMIEFKNDIQNLPDKNMETILEYICLFQENKFYKVIHCLNKTIDKILEPPKMNEIREEEESKIIMQVHSLQSLKTKLANRDKRYIPWFNHRYFKNYTEYYKTTKSVLNDEAMSPDQINILQDKYPTVIFSTNVFSGQRICQPYNCLDYELLDLSQEVRSYISSSANTVKGFINDYLNIFKIGFKKDAVNLKHKNDLLKTFLAKYQLKSALLTWYTREKYPTTPKQFKFLNLKFRDNMYKKVYAQKTAYLKSVEDIIGPHKLDMMNDKDMGVLSPIEQEDLKAKRIKAMSKYTLIDQVSMAKAEVVAIRDEIDKNLMVNAIDIIEKEYAALSSALD